MKGRFGWAALLALPLVLGGCEAILGSPEAPPLPGERISILTLQKQLEPDPRIADLEVRLPRPWVNESWPQAGGFPNHAMHHLALGDNPRLAWRTDIGAGSGGLTRLLANPVVGGGQVFALDSEGRVSALDAQSGSRQWQVQVTPEDEERGALGGGIALASGVLFIGTAFGEVIALDARSGAQFWRQSIGVPLPAAPSIDDGRVFVVTYDNQLFALDAGSGDVLWSYVGIAETAGLIGAGSAAVEGGLVVAPFSSGELVALRVENGNVAWSDSLVRTGRATALTEISDINSRPVIDRGVVYGISHGGRMVAVDARTGARIWTQSVAGIESPWVAGDFVFVVTTEAEIVALSRPDGRIRWVTQLDRYRKPNSREGAITWSGPVLAGDRLLAVSSEGVALAVSPYTGQVLGQLRLRTDAAIAPVVAGETLYILTEDGALSALR